MSFSKDALKDSQAFIAQLEDAYLEDMQILLAAEIKNRQKIKVTTAKAEIHKIAASVGLSVDALMGTHQAPRKSRAPVPVPPKYRNPNNPQDLWSGRGRAPIWMAELLASGSKKEDFAIG